MDLHPMAQCHPHTAYLHFEIQSLFLKFKKAQLNFKIQNSNITTSLRAHFRMNVPSRFVTHDPSDDFDFKSSDSSRLGTHDPSDDSDSGASNSSRLGTDDPSDVSNSDMSDSSISHDLVSDSRLRNDSSNSLDLVSDLRLSRSVSVS